MRRVGRNCSPVDARVLLSVEPDVTDAGRLRQVLLNLLTDAIKFTGEGTTTIDVEHDTRDDVVSFSIHEYRSRHRTRAPRADLRAVLADRTDNDAHTGRSGLGLAVSRHLARTLGGDIRVDSAAGQGSVFTLTLSRTSTGAKKVSVAGPDAT